MKRSMAAENAAKPAQPTIPGLTPAVIEGTGEKKIEGKQNTVKKGNSYAAYSAHLQNQRY